MKKPKAAVPCQLCATCPFRPGRERIGWHEGSRTAILAGLKHPRWFMECHDTSEAACAGFVAVLGSESAGVRLAVARGRLLIQPAPGMARNFTEFDERARGAKGWT